jgi:hypothetical protein
MDAIGYIIETEEGWIVVSMFGEVIREANC